MCNVFVSAVQSLDSSTVDVAKDVKWFSVMLLTQIAKFHVTHRNYDNPCNGSI